MVSLHNKCTLLGAVGFESLGLALVLQGYAPPIPGVRLPLPAGGLTWSYVPSQGLLMVDSERSLISWQWGVGVPRLLLCGG